MSKFSRLIDLPVSDHQLMIGGRTLASIVAEHGPTPCYIYDRQAIAARLELLREVMPAEISVHYAVKANPHVPLLRAMQTKLDGFDVSSGAEMGAVLNLAMPAADISFSGPGKSLAELSAALTHGVGISIESITEFERIKTLKQSINSSSRLSIRVNPDFELRGAGMKMVGRASAFGIDIDQLQALINNDPQATELIDGLHVFSGAQSLVTDAIVDVHRSTFALAHELTERRGRAFSVINIGGGYGIPYYENDEALDIDAIGAELSALMGQYHGLLGEPKVVVELGRYIVGEAGYYVCEVTDIKRSKGELFAIVNGGMHHHLANSGNFGQVIRRNYPIVVGNKLGLPPAEAVTLVGPLCTPLDVVGRKVNLPKLELGDLIVIFQSGAYGLSASPSRFISHPEPVEIVV